MGKNIFVVAVCILSVFSASAENIDKLKPETFIQIKGLKQLFEDVGKNGLEYEVKLIPDKIDPYPDLFGHSDGPPRKDEPPRKPVVRNTVGIQKLPKEVEAVLKPLKEIRQIEKEIFEGEAYEDERWVAPDFAYSFIEQYFAPYFSNAKSAFYAIVFLLYTNERNVGRFAEREIKEIVAHDEKAWENSYTEERKKYFIERLDIGHNSYDRWLFLENLPEKYFWDFICDDRAYWEKTSKSGQEEHYDNSRSAFIYGPSGTSEIQIKTVQELEHYIDSAIRNNFNFTNVKFGPLLLKDIKSLSYFWTIYLLHDTSLGPKKDDLQYMEAFSRWLKTQEYKPMFSATMMGLFIVKGYDFDESTGNYIPNDLGKTMLDYVVENPIPENAERLKIIRDGGNQKLISELMEKYKTKEKWDELFSKTPADKTGKSKIKMD